MDGHCWTAASLDLPIVAIIVAIVTCELLASFAFVVAAVEPCVEPPLFCCLPSAWLLSGIGSQHC